MTSTDIYRITVRLALVVGLLWHVALMQGQQAPVTMAADVTATTPDALIPIMVSGFQDIAAVSLLLHYDDQIAEAVTVTPHPSLVSGSFSYNVLNPGELIISWFTPSGGATLPDGSAAFSISFNRVSFGTTTLTWIDNGISCEYAAWGGGSVIVLDDYPATSFYTNGSLTYLQVAPKTTLPVAEVCEGGVVVVPVIVEEFINIGALSLTFTYDANVISFTGFTAHPALPANFVVAEHSPGRVVASGYVDPQDPGITLPDDETLFVALFIHLGGTTTLGWFDNGVSCEYAPADPPGYPPLMDVPQTSFYFDGSVNGYPRPTVAVTGTTTINKGASTDITFTFTGTPPWDLSWSDGVTSTVATGITQSPYLLTVSPLETTTYTATAVSDLYCIALPQDLTGEAVVTVRGPIFLKTYLQGAYNTATQSMRTNLNTLNYLPHNQPYATTPLAYAGTESVTGFLGSVVDWVVVELRTGTAANTMIARQAALVLSDGNIVSAEDQTIPPTFGSITPGLAYYVVIYHRNHLPVMTANAITLPNTATTPHDFTTNPTVNIYGGLQGVIEVEPGVYAQIAGDINMDNRLIYSGSSNDRALVYNDIQAGMAPNQAFFNSLVYGYYKGDLNMDGVVRYSGSGNDPAIIYNNIQYFTDPTFFNTTYQSPTPVDYTITY